MAFICIASATGSPGATTLGLSLMALSWPKGRYSRLLFVEASPDGGVLAIRYRLGTEPGLTSLAAAGRYSLNQEQILQHAQRLPGGMLAIVGPDSSEQADFVLATSGENIAKAFGTQDNFLIVADCGRARANSSMGNFYEEADLVIMASRPEDEQLIPAASNLAHIRERNKNVCWVLIGEGTYSPREVMETFGFPVLGTIKDDKKGSRLLSTGGKPKRFEKSSLVRSVKKLAKTLSGTYLQESADSHIVSQEVV